MTSDAAINRKCAGFRIERSGSAVQCFCDKGTPWIRGGIEHVLRHVRNGVKWEQVSRVRATPTTIMQGGVRIGPANVRTNNPADSCKEPLTVKRQDPK